MLALIIMAAGCGSSSGSEPKEDADSKAETVTTAAPEVATTEMKEADISWDGINNLAYSISKSNDNEKDSFDFFNNGNEITLQKFNWDSITDENEKNESVEEYLWVIKCSDETITAANDFVMLCNECKDKGTSLEGAGKKDETIQCDETGIEPVEHEWKVTKSNFAEVLQCKFDNGASISFYVYKDGKMYAEYNDYADVSWMHPVDEVIKSRVNKLANAVTKEIETAE